MTVEIQAVYTVPELGRMLRMNRDRTVRMLRRLNVPIKPGRPLLVFLSDLKALAPEVWSSLEEAAHLNGLRRA